MKLIVEAKNRQPLGALRYGNKSVPCALGPAGFVADKKEGDGATPIASMKLIKGLYRSDRLSRPVTKLPMRATDPADGWCDDPTLPQYNQLVKLPFKGSHEKLWRKDHVYNICIVLDWNIAPAVVGKGSAIFFHLARNGYTPTEGCIAVNLSDMLEILRTSNADTVIETRLVG